MQNESQVDTPADPEDQVTIDDYPNARVSLTSHAWAIDQELARLGANTLPTNVNGIVCYLDDDLPLGWVRMGDGTGVVYGRAYDVLRALENAKPTDATDDDGKPDGWQAAWNALVNSHAFRDNGTLRDEKPDDNEDEHWSITPLMREAGPWYVVRVETNGGPRYHYAPAHDDDYLAENYVLGFSERYETADEAVEAAERQAAEDEARERENDEADS